MCELLTLIHQLLLCVAQLSGYSQQLSSAFLVHAMLFRLCVAILSPHTPVKIVCACQFLMPVSISRLKQRCPALASPAFSPALLLARFDLAPWRVGAVCLSLARRSFVGDLLPEPILNKFFPALGTEDVSEIRSLQLVWMNTVPTGMGTACRGKLDAFLDQFSCDAWTNWLFRRRLLLFWLWLLLRPVLFFEESGSDFQSLHLLFQNCQLSFFSLSTTLTSLKFLFLSEALSRG